MKKAILFPLLVSAICFVGCFFGGEEDTATIDNKDSLATGKTIPISPGLYVGDYTWIDSNKAGFESELKFNADGTFRQFWISDNESVYEVRGEWAQHDSNLHFLNLFAADGKGGLFKYADFLPIDPDTNSLSQVTDTSFIRREYTPLRQKPYWIRYVKRTFTGLKNGTYQFTLTKPAPSDTDSLATMDYKYIVKLDGKSFGYSYREDTLELFQATADWYQLGTFFITEKNLSRSRVDTSSTFSSWDSLPAFLMYRVKQISDTSFQMWTPGVFPTYIGTWDVYSTHLGML